MRVGFDAGSGLANGRLVVLCRGYYVEGLDFGIGIENTGRLKPGLSFQFLGSGSQRINGELAESVTLAALFEDHIRVVHTIEPTLIQEEMARAREALAAIVQEHAQRLYRTARGFRGSGTGGFPYLPKVARWHLAVRDTVPKGAGTMASLAGTGLDYGQ